MSEPGYPTTANGESMLVNEEWHGPRCAVHRTRKYRDCDCSLVKVIVATEKEAVRRAAQPGRSASDGVGDALSRALLQWEMYADATRGTDENPYLADAGDPEARLYQECVRVRDAALATTPPAPDGERVCVECGQPERSRTHMPDTMAYDHPFQPLPPTPAAAVSVSALVAEVEEIQAEALRLRAALDRSATALHAIGRHEGHVAFNPEQPGFRGCPMTTCQAATAALAAARDTGARGETEG